MSGGAIDIEMFYSSRLLNPLKLLMLLPQAFWIVI